MTPKTPRASNLSRMVSAMAPPIAGSVPVPNSSIRTKERLLAWRSMTRILPRCELYVLRSLSMDCWSPMSTNMSSNTDISLTGLAGTSQPHCIMYCNSPVLLRHTDLPPALGPDMTSMCLSLSSLSVSGTMDLPSRFSVCSKSGWRPSFMYICRSAVIIGICASIIMATSALLLMKSICDRNISPPKSSSMNGRSSSANRTSTLST